MQRRFSEYSLVVRVAHALTALLFAGAAITGLRLAWFLNQDWLSPSMRNLIDSIAPIGDIYTWHAAFGVLLAAVGVLYVVYLLVTGEGMRLFDLFRPRHYSFVKKVFYLLTLLVGLVGVFTGVSIYAGLYYGASGYLFNSFLHHWCFRLLAIFTLVHLAEVLFFHRHQINEIFFGKRGERFVRLPALVVAALFAATVGITVARFVHQPAVLVCRELNRTAIIDGREFDIEWIGADSITVQTAGGANFESSASPVTIKAFRNRQRIYFLVRWEDPTRSYNRYLVKTKGGWLVEESEYIGPSGEDIFAEDQLGLFFSRRDDCASSCHIGAPGKTGLHYTDGDTADVWVWRSVATDPIEEADDRFWQGFDSELTGGRKYDNKAAGGYESNLDEQWRQPYFIPVHRVARYWLEYGTSTYEPYDPENDTFSIGARVPALLVAPTTGDRGDVTARGRWSNGVWTVELSRRITTGSGADIPFRGEIFLGVAVFDNADSKHTYHLQPIKLVVE